MGLHIDIALVVFLSYFLKEIFSIKIMRANMKSSVCPTPKRGGSPVKVNLDHVYNMKSSVCPTPKGVAHWQSGTKSSVFPTPKRGGSRLMWTEYFLWEFKRHRSCEINMKSNVCPTSKRGGFTGQSETASYITLVGGIHWLVPMLAT